MSLFVEGKLFNIANAESGGGSGDQHNLGWYATQAALEEAYPTAEAGDYAIVGATDTVWIWDTDNDEWTDSGAKSPTYTAGTGISITNNEISVADPVLVNKASSIFMDKAIAIGPESDARTESVQIGYRSIATTVGSEYLVCIGAYTGSQSSHGIAIGHYAKVGLRSQYAIQLGSTGSLTSNSDADTFKVANRNGNFEIMSADGTIPEARLADTTNAQQGDVLTLDANGNAVWQVGGSGGGLPSQTGNAGKFLTTDGTDASWSDKPLVNAATGSRTIAIGGTGTIATIYSTSLGTNATPAGNFSVSLGDSSESNGGGTIAIGYAAKTSAAGAIQLNTSVAATTNSDADTFKVANRNGNFEIMSADGTIPAARHAALPSADGTYVLKLVIANGVPTLSWVAE